MDEETLAPVDALTAAFERAGMKDPPEPVEVDEEEDQPEEASDEESADDSADEESATEDDAEEQPAESDTEEVEFEGKAYKVPKEIKDALLRQADYTRKTQEVAAQRQAAQAQAESIQLQAKFQQANFAKLAEAHALQSQLQQFAQVNWDELANSNPAQYLQLDRQQRQLQEAAMRVNGELQTLGQQFQQQMQAEKQEAQARCIEELKTTFKDFGPELLKSLDETGRHFGFTGEELAAVVDPRMIRVLHAATQQLKLQGSKSLVAKKVQTAAPVQVKGARSAQVSQANAALTEARARLKQTGKTKDAEAFLAARFAKAMR